MNYLYLLIEVFLVFLLMIILYKTNKKEGLYIFTSITSALISFILIATIQIFSFQINLGIPFIIGIFIANNIIIQKYGIDEVKKVLYTYGLSYIITIILISLVTLISKYKYQLSSNDTYNLLFGYELNNLRYVVAGFISIGIMLWMGSGIYYSVRKSKNILILSNLVSTFLISLIESILFILIAYIGSFSTIEILGMISVRYIIEVLIAAIGLIPIYILVKYIDK